MKSALAARYAVIAALAVWAVMLAASDLNIVAKGSVVTLIALVAVSVWRPEVAAVRASEYLAGAGVLLMGMGSNFYVLAGVMVLPLLLKHTGRGWDRFQESIIKEAK